MFLLVIQQNLFLIIEKNFKRYERTYKIYNRIKIF